MKDKVKKTNAARILDEMHIAYELKEFPIDLDHLDAVSVAGMVGMPPGQVFKTLCARGDKTGILFAVIKGDGELNMKAIAKASGNKSVAMVHLKELQPLTGYIHGGCSPLGAKKKYPVFLDHTADNWEKIAISAGQRGMQLILSPQDLLTSTNGTYFENV